MVHDAFAGFVDRSSRKEERHNLNYGIMKSWIRDVDELSRVGGDRGAEYLLNELAFMWIE